MKRFHIDHRDDKPGMSEGIRFDLIEGLVVYNLEAGRYVSRVWEVITGEGTPFTRQHYDYASRP